MVLPVLLDANLTVGNAELLGKPDHCEIPWRFSWLLHLEKVSTVQVDT